MMIRRGLVFGLMASIALTSIGDWLPKNERQYTYDNLRILSTLWNFNKYLALEIGDPITPYNGKRALLIKLSNGTIVNLATISVNELERNCPGRGEDISAQYYADCASLPLPPKGTRWPPDTKKIFDPFAQFFVHGGKVIALRINWDRYDIRSQPEIGDAKTGKMYAFPLSEADVITLFGKPAKIIDSLQQ